MRKTLTIFCLLFIMLLGLSQMFLPSVAEKTLESRLGEALKTERVTAKVSGGPAILLLFGHFAHVDLTAENALLGDVRVTKATLTGKAVDLSIDGLTRGKFAVKNAADLRVDALVTAEDLADLLRRKVDRLQTVTVVITPELILMDGQAKIFGQTADIHIEGKVLEDDGSILFHMTRLDIKNALLGRAITGNFFGDIEMMDLRRLDLPVTLDTVEQKSGAVLFSASRHEGQ